MHLLAPSLLWGCLAVAIPLALHFLFRARPRTLPWAAMQFLLASLEHTSRRLRFRELLLLLLRCGLLALLALAFARPTSSRMADGARGEAVDAVLLFDTSMSMGALERSKSRLAQACDAAEQMLEALPPRSTVQVVTTAGGQAACLGPHSPERFDQARQLLSALRPSSLASDLAPGVAEAARLLQLGQAANKELYLFSDMQRLAWDRQGESLVSALRALKDRVNLSLVRAGAAGPRNVAIVGVAPHAGLPRPGERVPMAVLVRNTGSEPAADLQVSLRAGKGHVETQAVPRLAPGETRAVPLHVRLDAPGPQVLTATVAPDDLPGDNRLDRVLHVRDQVRVLVVDGAPAEREPRRAASFYLAHALQPAQEDQRASHPVQLRVVPTALATPAQLEAADLCILCNVALPTEADSRAALSAEFVFELERFVRRGQSLLIFAGDQVDPAAYNQKLGTRGLLPYPLGAIRKADAKHPFEFNRETFALPDYAVFREDSYYQGFNDVGVWQYVEMIQSPAPARSSVALRYRDGQAAIARARLDRGEILFVGSSPHYEVAVDPKGKIVGAKWSMLPLVGKLFVPLVQATVNHLVQGQADKLNTVAGETLTLELKDKALKPYILVQPDGTQVRLGVPEQVDGRLRLTLADLQQAGIYRVRSPDVSGEDAGMAIAVTPDLDETADLSTYSDAQLDEKLGFAAGHLRAGEALQARSDRLQREWTQWLLLAAVLVLVCEGLYAWRCGQAV